MNDFNNIINPEIFSKNFPEENSNLNFLLNLPLYPNTIGVNNLSINWINSDNGINNNSIQDSDNIKLQRINPINLENKSNSSHNIENIVNRYSTHSASNSNQVHDIHLKIFRIEKDNKNNRGRIKKNTKYSGKHNKFSEDNIIRKIKGRFLEKCRIYINKEYKRYLLSNKLKKKKTNVLLQRIAPKLSRKIKKDENLKWLRTQLYLVFSENVSVKCSLYEPEHNKKQIEKILKDNEAKNVIDILNKPIKEMFNAFILNKNIPGFDTINVDIKELKEKMEKDNEENIGKYLKKYRNIALNFESIFIKKSSRQNKYNL